MDIGELRQVLVHQYYEAAKGLEKKKFFKPKYQRAVEQVRKDIEALDEIMARNFGVAYNSDLNIYE